MYTLGGITLFGFILLGITGLYLAQYYHPAPTEARDSVIYIVTRVRFGNLVRSLHFWLANLVLVTMVLHDLGHVDFDEPFTRLRHQGIITNKGAKMSKSKGNFYTLRDLLEKNVDPMTLRLLLLSTHYRKMLNFTFAALNQAQSSLQRIKDFLFELKSRSFKKGKSQTISRLIENARKKFIDGLSDDLNI
jgi:leucyl-tRNA synthetase